MAHWQASTTKAPPKSKAELRLMLTDAVRNTQPSLNPAPKLAPKTKKEPA